VPPYTHGYDNYALVDIHLSTVSAHLDVLDSVISDDSSRPKLRIISVRSY
jgi:hypothetical protein